MAVQFGNSIANFHDLATCGSAPRRCIASVSYRPEAPLPVLKFGDAEEWLPCDWKPARRRLLTRVERRLSTCCYPKYPQIFTSYASAAIHKNQPRSRTTPKFTAAHAITHATRLAFRLFTRTPKGTMPTMNQRSSKVITAEDASCGLTGPNNAIL